MLMITSITDSGLRCYIEANLGRIVELFSPRHIIAFGSRVNGTAREDSDIDLIVVSDAFEGIPFLERSRMFNEVIRWHIRVDVWCLTVMEFERMRRQVGIVADASREGIWVLRGELLSDEEVEGIMTIEEQVNELMAQGEVDLQVAKDNSQSGHYYAAVFFAQQSAEKFLKALYLLRFQVTPPRTHDLERLASELRAPQDIIALSKTLTDDYIRSRYVNATGMAPFRVFDAGVASERIQQAEKVCEWVKEQLRKS